MLLLNNFGNARGGKPPRRRRAKYGNRKVSLDGQTFDSTKERDRYSELKLLQEAGKIFHLQTQVVFSLIPEQREPGRVGKRGGVYPGKIIERKCEYKADFVYYLPDGKMVVEDTKCKWTKTKDYVIKRKLMLWLHGIRIREV